MKIKKAFTLAEFLIVLIIIFILTTMAIFTIQRYDKGIRFLYSNTYHILDRALFNAMNFSDLPSPFVESELDENNNAVEVSPEEGAVRLCRYLIRYINANSEVCSPEQYAFAPQNFSADNLAQTDGIHFGTVKFTAANGIDYYISRRLPDANNANAQEGGHTFFLIYADINGALGPNSMEYIPPEENGHQIHDPDVFAFAALDIGRICPLGVPEIDPRYMQTRVAYYALNSDLDDDEGAEAAHARFSITSLPYYISKAQAWGYYLPGKSAEDNRFIIDEEPTSYNDYIRSLLPQNTRIYEFMGEVQNLQVPQGIHLMSRPINEGEFACEEFQAENCWVIIDKYLY